MRKKSRHITRSEAAPLYEENARQFANALREPEPIEVWSELLAGTLEVREVQALLDETDVWTIPGLVQRRQGGEAGFTLVRVDHAPTFETWLRAKHPEYADLWDAAVALRGLENEGSLPSNEWMDAIISRQR